jgi:hypothetical protein
MRRIIWTSGITTMLQLWYVTFPALGVCSLVMHKATGAWGYGVLVWVLWVAVLSAALTRKSAAIRGEPSCCARTREECAQVARDVGALDAAPDGEYERGWHDCARAIARDLDQRAAIRRTGDTP